jgi:hypothetical protein
MMARCPVCSSLRVVVVIAPSRRAFCTGCGARWIQEGSMQRAVERVLLQPEDLPGTIDRDRGA